MSQIFGSTENGKLKTKDPIMCMMLREKWGSGRRKHTMLLPNIARLSIPAFRRFKRRRAGDPGSNPGRSTIFKIKVRRYVANEKEVYYEVG